MAANQPLQECDFLVSGAAQCASCLWVVEPIHWHRFDSQHPFDGPVNDGKALARPADKRAMLTNAINDRVESRVGSPQCNT